MDDLTKFIKAVLPDCRLQPLMDELESLGVNTVEDLNFVEPDDLGVLKKVEARKLLARVTSFLTQNASSETDRDLSIVSDSYPGSPASSLSSVSIQRFFTPVRRTSTGQSSSSERDASCDGQLVDSCQGSPSSSFTPQSTPRSCHDTNKRLHDSNQMGSNLQSPTVSEMGAPPVLDNNWHFNFSIPWSIMPSHIKNTLEKKERPTARDRREMIRLITAEILSVCKNPGKKHLSEIARKMVLAYPNSLKDVIEDQVVGSGYDSITKQLQSRVDNYKRLEPPKMTQPSSDDNRKKRQRKDAYGCVNADPQLPGNLEEQRKIKEELHKMFYENEKDEKKIETLMINTFASQRRDVLNEKETHTLKEEWPYLFFTVGLKAHFCQLTGVQIDGEFEEAMNKKFRKVLGYFKSLHPERGSLAAKLLPLIEDTAQESCGAVLMLLAHFKEDHDKMFFIVEDTCISTEVNTQNLPTTPCIVVCGESPLTASNLMVAVDQLVVNDSVKTFAEALVDMFMTYYVLNIDYPVQLAATLEFLQRCMFKINPDKGSKVQKQGKKKCLAVNPKVLSLISKISEHDWME